MGHSVHNFASRARYFTLAHTARDFMEMPGVLLEHVFWNPAVIRFRSGRRGPDGQEEKIPINTVHQLIPSRLTGETLTFNQTVFYATADLRLHMAESQERIRNANIVQDFSILRKEICLHSDPEDAGGAIEDAKTISRLRVFMQCPGVYYSYVKAKAISYDRFESRLRQLLPDEDVEKLEDLVRSELRAECTRFREIVLRPGGTLATRYMETLTQYMGRKSSADAWLDVVSKKA